jgi:hypothetical protein
MMLYLAMICGALAILVTIVSTASIDLSTARTKISLASDAKTSASSHFRLQKTEESAILAMIDAIPGLGLLPRKSNAIRILFVAV